MRLGGEKKRWLVFWLEVDRSCSKRGIRWLRNGFANSAFNQGRFRISIADLWPVGNFFIVMQMRAGALFLVTLFAIGSRGNNGDSNHG